MTVTIGEDHSDEALLVAASIWADATAARDGLTQPVAPTVKLPGLRAALALPGATLYTAARDELSVGFVVLVPLGRRLEVRYLAVGPSAWGQGIAGELLAHVHQVAMTGGLEAIDLWVLADNERAVAVYVRAGWAVTADVKSQVDTRRTEVRLERLVIRRES